MADLASGSQRSTTAKSTSDELKDDAQSLKETAERQGKAKAEQEKERVGRTAKSASSAMQTAADELRDDSDAPDWLASAFSSVAREVDSLASRLQDKSPNQLAAETRRFARDNPTTFLAASAAAGFAAARFLRAGAEYHDDYDAGSNGIDGYDSSSRTTSIGSGQSPSSGSRSGVSATLSRNTGSGPAGGIR